MTQRATQRALHYRCRDIREGEYERGGMDDAGMPAESG